MTKRLTIQIAGQYVLFDHTSYCTVQKFVLLDNIIRIYGDQNI